MRRREFITFLGGAAVWPVAAHAQQIGKPPTIGFLGSSTSSAMSRWIAAFVHRLRELGWIEGRTVAIEYRWGEVDVIVTYGTPPSKAAKQATAVIPIVFAA